MSDFFKKKEKKSESIKKNRISYYDPPYNIKYNANGTWKDKNSKVRKVDHYKNSKFKGTYYGNGLWGPDPNESRQENDIHFLEVLLIILCAGPYR